MNKKVIIILVIILLFLILCGLCVGVGYFTYNSGKGSGNVISEDRSVEDFTKISFEGSGTVYIKQGDMESLTLEVEDNLASKLETVVKGDTLHLRWKKKFNLLPAMVSPTKEVKFYITVKDLTQYLQSGSGSVDVESLSTDSLKIVQSGSGAMSFDVSVTDLEVFHSGSGAIKISGNTDSLDINFSGSGAFNTNELESNDVKVSISGSGVVVVRANSTLKGSISESGVLTYYGDVTPDINVSGSGVFSKGDE